MDILILGAGALGSNIAKTLVPDLRGAHRISLMDFDTVEERNIQAGTQFYTEDQIGLPKVEALQFNLYKWFNREVTVVNDKLTIDNLSMLAGFKLVIDCFDNFESRNLVQDFCTKFKVPCLHIGFSPEMTFSVEWFENYTVPSDIINGLDICEMPGAAGFVNLVASLSTLVIEEYIYNAVAWEFVGNKLVIKEIK